MPINSYRDLKVWQLAMDLVEDVYPLSQSFPQQERFGLAFQMQKAAISIPSNIAEGHARDSTKDFLHHLSFALGSLAELETQLILANSLGYLKNFEENPLMKKLDELGKMIRGLQKSLKAKL